jgi:hypothetical protein
MCLLVRGGELDRSRDGLGRTRCCDSEPDSELEVELLLELEREWERRRHCDSERERELGAEMLDERLRPRLRADDCGDELPVSPAWIGERESCSWRASRSDRRLLVTVFALLTSQYRLLSGARRSFSARPAHSACWMHPCISA